MSQPNIESVIEEKVKLLYERYDGILPNSIISKTADGFRKDLEEIAAIARSEERTRCVEIVEKLQSENAEDFDASFSQIKCINDTCGYILEAINTNNK